MNTEIIIAIMRGTESDAAKRYPLGVAVEFDDEPNLTSRATRYETRPNPTSGVPHVVVYGTEEWDDA